MEKETNLNVSERAVSGYETYREKLERTKCYACGYPVLHLKRIGGDGDAWICTNSDRPCSYYVEYKELKPIWKKIQNQEQGENI